MVMENIRRVRGMVSGFTFSDLLALFADAMALKNSISRFYVCLDGDRLVFIGDVEGELKIKNAEVVARILRWVRRCEK